jgi:DoxX-like protein
MYLVILTIVVNAGAAVADFAKARFVLANSDELGLDRKWVLPLGLLKAAGAAGLLIGLLGVALIGEAAAVGLVLFFAGALIVHVHQRVFHNIAYPGVFFVLAVATLIATLRS